MPVWLFLSFSRVGSWLSRRSLAELACIALALFAGLQTLRVSAEQRHSAKLETQLRKVTAARDADRKAYEQAQAEAKAKNLAEVRATEERYKRNNDEAVATLNSRLERLRRELSDTTDQGSPRGSSPPKTDDTTGTPSEARVCIEAKDFLRAAENEERYDELITLILKQTGQ